MPTTEIYTLSLHDALPIFNEALKLEAALARLRTPQKIGVLHYAPIQATVNGEPHADFLRRDRKSTRLNSSHSQISYAVFCLKKKKSLPQLSQLLNFFEVSA